MNRFLLILLAVMLAAAPASAMLAPIRRSLSRAMPRQGITVTRGRGLLHRAFLERVDRI